MNMYRLENESKRLDLDYLQSLIALGGLGSFERMSKGNGNIHYARPDQTYIMTAAPLSKRAKRRLKAKGKI